MSIPFLRILLGGLLLVSAGVVVADEPALDDNDQPYLTYDELTADSRLPKNAPPATDQAYLADPNDSDVTERSDEADIAPPRRERPLYAQTASDCREYRQMIVTGGEERAAYGTACLQPDGSWKIISAPSIRRSSTQQYAMRDRVYREPTRYRYFPRLFDR